MERQLKLISVALDALVVRTPRSADPALRESVTAVGLLTPPLVRRLADGRYEVLSGARRVDAARREADGHFEGVSVECLRIEVEDDRDADAVSIVSNFHRALSALRRTREVGRFKRWYEELNPPRPAHRPVKNLSEADKLPRFDEILAEELGMGTTVVREAAALDKVLDPGIDPLIEASDLDPTLGDLKRIAKLTTPEEQLAVVKEMAESETKIVKLARRTVLYRRLAEGPRRGAEYELFQADFEAALHKVFPAGEAHLVLTDPPWESRDFLGRLDAFAFGLVRVLRVGGRALVITGGEVMWEIGERLARAGLRLRAPLSLRNTKRLRPSFPERIVPVWLPIIVAEKGEVPPDRVEMWGNEIQDHAGWDEEAGFSWGKGEAAMIDAVDRYSLPGDLVIDPFLGSGTTGVAARRIARHFLGSEIHEERLQQSAKRIAACAWNDETARPHRVVREGWETKEERDGTPGKTVR